jgi:hypothetical protein
MYIKGKMCMTFVLGREGVVKVVKVWFIGQCLQTADPYYTHINKYQLAWFCRMQVNGVALVPDYDHGLIVRSMNVPDFHS